MQGARVGFWVRELDPTSPKSLCAILKLLHATAKTWCTPEKNRGSRIRLPGFEPWSLTSSRPWALVSASPSVKRGEQIHLPKVV